MKKKAVLSLALCLALVFALALPGFAANYDQPAQELKDIGLFQGTNNGFELDRAATRTEAGVMLVRLLGMEQQAKEQFAAGEISHPFQDVPAWADAYVAWMYKNGLTKGVDATHFGTGDCNAQMYSTFVLRALGYSEADGDFTYAEALKMAERLGLYQSEFLSDAFLRDEVAAMSYQALATRVKGTETTLLQKLVDDGVVKQEAARELLDKQAIYAEYCAATKLPEGRIAMAMRSTVKMAARIPALGMTTESTADADMAVILDENGMQMSAVVKSTTGEQTATVREWLKDGWLYVDGGEDGKYKAELNLAGLDDLSDLGMVDLSAAEAGPLYLFDKIVKNADGSYTISYNPALNDIVNEMVSAQIGDDQSVKINFKLNDTTVYFKDGQMQKILSKMEVAVATEVGGQTVDMDMDMDITVDITAWGDAVTITYPADLDTYPELTDDMLTDTAA